MKGLLKHSIIAASLLAGLSATTLDIHSGWNLVSLGDVNASTADCILNQLPTGSLLFKYNGLTKKWSARSNSQEKNNLISSNTGIDMANTIEATDGFWVYTPDTTSNTFEINSYCQNPTPQPNPQVGQLVFGNDISMTPAQIISDGNTYFDPDDDGYEEIYIGANGVATINWHEHNDDGSWTKDSEGDVNLSVNGNGLHYVASDGSEGDLDINFVKEVIQAGDQNLTGYGVYAIDINGTVTKEGGFDQWDPEDWQPTYYDQASGQQKPITDIQTLVNHFTDANETWWQSDDDNYYMFASAPAGSTSGHIVKAIYKGQRPNCTGDHNECSMYERGTQVIGSWQIKTVDGDTVLEVTIPGKIKQYRYNSNHQLEERSKELVGNKYHMLWISSTGDASQIEPVLQSMY